MLLFDLDGTLIDSNGVWLEVDKTFLARHGYEYSQEYHDGVAHSILPKIIFIWRNPARRSSRSGWSWPATPMTTCP